jgi:hypothetical protein
MCPAPARSARLAHRGRRPAGTETHLMVDLYTPPPGDVAAEAPTGVPTSDQSAPVPSDEAPLLDLAPVLRESRPWLLSAVIHMTVLVVLGLMFVHSRAKQDLLLEAGYADDFDEPIGEDLDTSQDEFQLDEQSLTPDQLPIVEDPLSMGDAASIAPQAVMPLGTAAPTTIGAALTGREPGMKESLVKAYGGTGRTESAVSLGLKWLASRQKADGMWSLSGPYSDGARTENEVAATAMALLAFQGAGYTHQGDPQHPFTPVVRRGWNALVKQMDSEGRFYHNLPRGHQLYTQAQCTIALCELYAMTGDPDYHELAQKAVDHCVAIQAPEGGWRYEPGTDSDMSVTGWFVMALQSARMAGIEVPSPVFEKIEKFLDTVARSDQDGYYPGSRYAYRPVDGATLPLTAEGLLCRQYLGWPHNDPRLNAGVEYILQNLPETDRRNVYYWYYATQVCHHMEGEPWRKWNETMRRLLPQLQEERGKERGSWSPNGDRWGDSGGRLYVTCLSICVLEVYYRHLPIYQTGILKRGF